MTKLVASSRAMPKRQAKRPWDPTIVMEISFLAAVMAAVAPRPPRSECHRQGTLLGVRVTLQPELDERLSVNNCILYFAAKKTLVSRYCRAGLLFSVLLIPVE